MTTQTVKPTLVVPVPPVTPPAAGVPVTRRKTGPKVGQSLFFVRTSRLRYVFNPYARGGKGQWEEIKRPHLGNFPILSVYAYDLEGAQVAARNFIEEQIGIMTGKGFTENWQIEKEGEDPTFKGWRLETVNPDGVEYASLFNIYVSPSCRRCGGTGIVPRMAHIYNGRCFTCGGSCNEEKPLDVRSQAPKANISGVDINNLDVKISRAKAPAKEVAAPTMADKSTDEGDPFTP